MDRERDPSFYMVPNIMFQIPKNKFDNMASESNKASKNDLLERVFFHDANIELIQDSLIKRVYRESKGEYLIEKQSKSAILSTMEYIFEDHGYQQKIPIKEQIRRLNNLVLDEIVGDIISQIRMNEYYVKTIDTVPTPLDRPINVSKAGTKTLPSITSIF